MRARLWVALCVAMIWGTIVEGGCDSELSQGGDSSPDGDADGDVDSDIDVCVEGDLTSVCSNGPGDAFSLSEANDYSFTGALDVTSVEVKSLPSPEFQNLTFDWSGLTRSFMDEGVNPTSGVDMLVVTAWNLSPAALEDAIINDELYSDVRIGAVCNETGGTVTSDDLLTGNICQGDPVIDRLDQVSGYFNAADPLYDPTTITHMALVKSGTDLFGDLDVKMVKFFTLNLNSQNTKVVIDDNSAVLRWTADLRSLKRIPTAIGNPNISLEWSNVYFNGLGNLFIPTQITRVVAAHYPMNVCALERDFLHLETIHDAWYEVVWTESYDSVDLSQLKDAAGNAFPGITDDGTWIAALFCGECNNPAPWFLTILQPC